jgi:glutathione S-transferase
VRQLLHWLARPYESRPVSIFEGEGRRPEYLAISPTGTVPALQLEDGRTLAESNAILMYLAEGSRWLPADAYGRARVWQWLSFEQERVESQVGALRHWRLTGKLARRPQALVEMKQRAGQQALAILDAQLATREWIAGDACTIADIALYAYAGLAEEAGLALGPHPHLRAWIARMQAQPGFLAQVHPYSLDPHSGNELP